MNYPAIKETYTKQQIVDVLKEVDKKYAYELGDHTHTSHGIEDIAGALGITSEELNRE